MHLNMEAYAMEGAFVVAVCLLGGVGWWSVWAEFCLVLA